MRGLINQFLRFAASGAVGTVVHYVTLILLQELVLENPTVASTAGFTLGALVNYHLARTIVFNSTVAHRRAMPLFALMASIGLLLNGLIVALLTETIGWHYLVAQVIATGTVLFWNFFANRTWTFR